MEMEIHIIHINEKHLFLLPSLLLLLLLLPLLFILFLCWYIQVLEYMFICKYICMYVVYDFLIIYMNFVYFIFLYCLYSYISLTHHGFLFNFVVSSYFVFLLLKVDNLYLMLHIKLLKLHVCWSYILLFICVI